MRKELDDALVRDFPRLYRHRHAPKQRPKLRISPITGKKVLMDVREPLALFGFEVLDGWEPLLRRLSAKLEPYAVKLRIAAGQVKEKFGGVRFYLSWDRPTTGPKEAWAAIHRAIEQAERESARTCEECGARAEGHTSNGWLRTRCEACWAAFLKAQPRRRSRGVEDALAVVRFRLSNGIRVTALVPAKEKANFLRKPAKPVRKRARTS
jgi:hypothetical protein